MGDVDFDHRLTVLQKDLIQHRYRMQTIEADTESLESDMAARGQSLMELETTLTALALILSQSFIPSVTSAVARKGALPLLLPPLPQPEPEEETKKPKKKGGLFSKLYDTITEAADALNDQYDEYVEQRKSKTKKRRSDAEKEFDPDAPVDPGAASQPNAIIAGAPVGGYAASTMQRPPQHAPGDMSGMDPLAASVMQSHLTQGLPPQLQPGGAATVAGSGGGAGTIIPLIGAPISINNEPLALERLRAWLMAPPQQQYVQRCLMEMANSPMYRSQPPHVQQAQLQACSTTAQHSLVTMYYELFPHERPQQQ